MCLATFERRNPAAAHAAAAATAVTALSLLFPSETAAWNGWCSAPAAMLARSFCATLAIFLSSGCQPPSKPHVPKPPDPKPGPQADGYVTIQPEVTVSKSAEVHPLPEVVVGENEDVMASILAIPPGR
jgi:hypothetical protein